jgi:transposase
MHKVFCGIDISKDSFHAALIDDRGQPCWSRSFFLSLPGFQALLDLLPTSPLLIGMESTGIYGLNLLSFLRNQGFDIRLLNPLLIANFAKLSLRQTKTDKRDAFTIAQFLRHNAERLPPSPDTDESLRALSREREALSRQITAAKNEIKRLLHILFPEILSLINPFTVSALTLLETFPSKDALGQALPSALGKAWAASGRGRKPSLALSRLIDAARTSVGVSSPAYESILRSKIRVLQLLEEELKAITQRLVQECRARTPQAMTLLNSINGLGDVTTAHFLAEIQARDFATPKKLIAFAGLDPIIRESGQWKGRGRISKRGNKSLRRVLFLMSVSVIRNNPIFRDLYDRKRSEGKVYRQAVLAVSHKLLRVIYALLQHQVPFNPAYQSL